MKLIAESRVVGHATYIHLGYLSAARLRERPVDRPAPGLVMDPAPIAPPDPAPMPAETAVGGSPVSNPGPAPYVVSGGSLLLFFLALVAVLLAGIAREGRPERPVFHRRLRLAGAGRPRLR